MPLNIPSLAARGVNLAWSVGSTALTPVIVRNTPTPTYDPAADTTTTTWGETITGKSGLLYDVQANEVPAGNDAEMSAVLEGRAKKLLLRGSDFSATLTNRSQVEIAGVLWDVQSVNPDPVAAVYILQLRR